MHETIVCATQTASNTSPRMKKTHYQISTNIYEPHYGNHYFGDLGQRNWEINKNVGGAPRPIKYDTANSLGASHAATDVLNPHLSVSGKAISRL